MYELKVRTRFAAAHYLNDYSGPCARLHGHTWKVEVAVQGRDLDHSGILVDFNDIKSSIKNIIGALDHRNLNDIEPFKAVNPTAENLARYIYEQLKPKLAYRERGIEITSVRVWESPDASATYMGVGETN